MKFQDLFLPVQTAASGHPVGRFGHHVQRYVQEFPAWQQADIVLIGCPWGTSAEAPGAIREALDALSLPVGVQRFQVADLGDLPGSAHALAYAEAIAQATAPLIAANKLVILLGGDNDIAIGQLLGYEARPEKNLRMLHIDSRFDLGDPAPAGPESFVAYLLKEYRDWLFDFTNLGYQRYLVTEEERTVLRELQFGAVRYGDLHEDIREAEPWLRDADLLTFDLGSVRHADAPGALEAGPGGFSAAEACRIARYAGMSPRLSSASITGFSPARDQHTQTAMLASMMVWYIVEGFYHRHPDHPGKGGALFTRYIMQLNATVESITFFHNAATDRWWMEVPYPDPLGQNQPESLMVACSQRDYAAAKNNDIPERWWAVYNKLA